MEQYKQEFIEFMVESDVLKFGEFTLKSGRKSPFFMNACDSHSQHSSGSGAGSGGNRLVCPVTGSPPGNATAGCSFRL